MNDKKINAKKPDGPDSAKINNENNAVNKNKDSYVIPSEAACSPEFSKGCIIIEDEVGKIFDEK
jgi:hypothetical protein